MAESDKTTVATEATPQKQYDFFVVHPAKLFLLALVTLGLYTAYWAYKNWDVIRKTDESGIYPFWRAIFGIFFTYSLYKKMGEERAAQYYIAHIAICLITLAVPALWWIWPLTIVPVYLLQDAYNKRHNHTPAFTFSTKAIIFAIIGLLITISTMSTGDMGKSWDEQYKESMQEAQNQSIEQ